MAERENIRSRLKKHQLTQVWLINQLGLRGIVTDKTEMSSVLAGTRSGSKADAIIELSHDILDKYEEDNLIPHEVDMVADNGDDRYGTVTDRVFILSCDEYRKYRKHVPLLPEWMWTCTPWYISDAGNSYVVRYVSYSRVLSGGYASDSYGVAPACVFNPKNLKLHRQVQMVEA